MDNQNYNPYENNPNTKNPYPSGNAPYGYRPYKPANYFETASLILGLISVVMCSCLYVSIICGALAIIFASLSRGGKMELDSKAKAGLILGIIGIVVTVLFYVYAFYIMLQEYGSLEGVLREACEMAGYDFDELYGDMFK